MAITQEQIAVLVKRLRDSTEWFHCDCEIKLKAADMLEQLAADNARVKEMRDQIVGDKINLRGELATMRVEVKRLRAALFECQEEIDDYIRHEYPHDHPVQERYRQRDYAANPARIALQEKDND